MSQSKEPKEYYPGMPARGRYKPNPDDPIHTFARNILECEEFIRQRDERNAREEQQRQEEKAAKSQKK